MPFSKVSVNSDSQLGKILLLKVRCAPDGEGQVRRGGGNDLSCRPTLSCTPPLNLSRVSLDISSGNCWQLSVWLGLFFCTWEWSWHTC